MFFEKGEFVGCFFQGKWGFLVERANFRGFAEWRKGVTGLSSRKRRVISLFSRWRNAKELLCVTWACNGLAYDLVKIHYSVGALVPPYREPLVDRACLME